MYEKPKDDPEAFLLGKQVQSLNQIQEIGKGKRKKSSLKKKLI